ncbi:MAG: HRDC domain-containing protein [Anaerolineae bacterium]|nr:HRDC domain-containing protein [Anaerolineae bacterium]
MHASPALPPAQIIRRTPDLRRAVDRLRGCSLLAVDTESNSLFAYTERVCLVQLSTRERDLIVDPLTVDDMSSLGDLLADPAIEVVFHAAEYDIISLKRDFGFGFANLFDTMMAARVCGWDKSGLGNILEEQFGVTVDKKHQRADWSRRPLPPDQLRYAQMDTHFLPMLRDRLRAELAAQNRLTEAREMFAALCALPAAEYHFDAEGYWRIQAVRDMGLRQVAIARELYLLRDSIARRLNRPPFKVFTDRALVALAELAPRSLEDLRSVAGLSVHLVQRDGAAIVEAVARGRQAEPPRPPQRRKPLDPAIQERYEALHEWRKQRAAERGVESDVIVPRETLWALARQMPASLAELDAIPGLGPWRRAEYGAELLAMLGRLNGTS